MSPRYRLITSLRVGPSDGSAFDGVKKAIELPPGSAATLMDVAGAGRIVRFWLTLPRLGQRAALKALSVRMFWDGETEPSVEAPLGDFFGASFGKPRRVVSAAFCVVGGAYLCTLVMPFNSGARVELRNDGPRTVGDLFYQLGYLEEPQRVSVEPTLHAQFRYLDVAASTPPIKLLEAVGEGRLLGLKLDIENRSWWLKPPFTSIALPRGFGLGLLEGWETIVVDGDTAGALVGTGAEDYFSAGFYFMGAPFCTPTHGCSYRSFFAGRVSAYRFHSESDAIGFNSSLSFSLDHGLKNQMAGTYHSMVYWYQLEPHQAFLPLPAFEQRLPSLAWLNPLQWLLLVMPLALLVAMLAYLLLT